MPLSPKKAKVFKTRFMTSYGRHVTQNYIFSIPLYPPPEYLSNDIWFVWVIRSRSPAIKKIESKMLAFEVFEVLRFLKPTLVAKWLPRAEFWRYRLINTRCTGVHPVAGWVNISALYDIGFPENFWVKATRFSMQSLLLVRKTSIQSYPQIAGIVTKHGNSHKKVKLLTDQSNMSTQ